MLLLEEDLKVDYLTRLLLDYKNAVIEEELKQCNADLTRPEVIADTNLMLDTMRRIKDLGEIQRQLAKLLGDRVWIAVASTRSARLTGQCPMCSYADRFSRLRR